MAPPALRLFSARACAPPVQEAAALYKQRTGKTVAVSMCSRKCSSAFWRVGDPAPPRLPDTFLEELTQGNGYDLAVAGSETNMDEGIARGLVLPGTPATLGYRRAALIVKAGNPKRIKRPKDLKRQGVRIAISMVDCLKGLYEDVLGRAHLLEKVRPNIVLHANGCYALIGAISEGLADAGFGWSAFAHLGAGKISVVELPQALTVQRSTTVGILRRGTEKKAKAFIVFLVSPEGRRIFRRHGWLTP